MTSLERVKRDAQRTAHARLIAAAPDLLMALQMALPALEWCEKQWAGSPQSDGLNALAAARSVITKATTP